MWEEVTSPNMAPKLFADGNLGIGSSVTDPARPTDLYVGGYRSIWTPWMTSLLGEQHVFKSTDAGLIFTRSGTIPEQPDAASVYTIVVDAHDATHLLSGLHEQDKMQCAFRAAHVIGRRALLNLRLGDRFMLERAWRNRHSESSTNASTS